MSVETKNGIMSPVKDETKKEKKPTKIPYKKAYEMQMLLLGDHDKAVKSLKSLIDAGKVTDPSAQGGGAKEQSPEAEQIRRAWQKLIADNKEAVDVLNARGVLPTLYFKGASKTTDLK